MRLFGRVWILGDDINTDLLAPGQYMRLPSAELAAHCLEAIRPDFAHNVQNGDMILAERGFGIGSSREQAAEALVALGIRAVIAKSFGGIFQRNAFNLGLMCLACPTLETSQLKEGEQAELDTQSGILHVAAQRFHCEVLPEFLVSMIANGGLIPHLMQGKGKDMTR